jgi:hypothetical protein
MEIKKHLKPIARPVRYLMQMANSKILYYTSKILKLKSEANVIDIEDIKRGRRKDTIFIMGSGYSINDITREEWQHIIDVGDILSFNYFFKGKFVPITYHICGEISGAPNSGFILMNSKYKKNIKFYYDELFSNPYYKDTTYFLRYKIDFTKAPVPIAMWALFSLNAFKNKQVCLYRIVIPKDAILEPSDSINAVSCVSGTLYDAVNISYILGYKKIVLVGIDLYDRRYFWLGRNETHEDDLNRGNTYSDIHSTADKGIRGMAVWNKYLIEKGVKLYIYNPRSLLNKVLPVYRNANNEEEG